MSVFQSYLHPHGSGTKEWKINGFGLSSWRSMAIRIGISIRSVCLLAQKFLNSRVFSWRSITHESLGMHSYARTIISMIKERKLFNKKGSSSTTGSQSGWNSFCKIHKPQVFWDGRKIRSSLPLPLSKPTIDWKILINLCGRLRKPDLNQVMKNKNALSEIICPRCVKLRSFHFLFSIWMVAAVVRNSGASSEKLTWKLFIRIEREILYYYYNYRPEWVLQ